MYPPEMLTSTTLIFSDALGRASKADSCEMALYATGQEIGRLTRRRTGAT